MSKNLLAKISLKALILTPLFACSTPPTAQYAGPWVQPSPFLKEEIDKNIRRIPWTHGLERVELVRWFSAVGEPAYPMLLELCQDSRPDVAGAALGALGGTGDKRLVSELHEIPWPAEDLVFLRLERARALMRLGDFSMAEHLIGGLGHNSLLVRSLCAQSLYEATGERMGFVANSPSSDRADAIIRWNEWWVKATTPSNLLAQAK